MSKVFRSEQPAFSRVPIPKALAMAQAQPITRCPLRPQLSLSPSQRSLREQAGLGVESPYQAIAAAEGFQLHSLPAGLTHIPDGYVT